MDTLMLRAAALETVGFARFEEGKWADAEEALRLAAVGRPESSDAWIGLGSALARQGRHEEAGIVFGIACLLAVDDGWPPLLAAESFLCSRQSDRARSALALFRDLEERGRVTDEQSLIASVLWKQAAGVAP